MRRLPLVAILAGCAPSAEGLRTTPEGDGPTVVVDWDAEPLPELPFPNDLATVPDATSPTGLRVNIPTKAATDFESELREKLDTLTGFGIYAPIWVRFEAPLDIANILDRHPDDSHLPTSYDDDAFFVIDVTPGSPTYGRPVDLDLDHGRYPYDVLDTDRYFPNDARSGQPALLFETVDEDVNGNGVLDPGEDSDDDGLLDVANIWPDGGDPFEDLLGCYDRQTNTLIMRPIEPMREMTTYAVVLTNRLIGEDGAPVRSPWEFVHHTRQTGALRPLVDLMPTLGLTIDDVAFAWTFTTGNVTGDLRDVATGLYDSEGPYASLGVDYPAGIDEALPFYDDAAQQDPWALPISVLANFVGPLGLVEEGAGQELLIAMFEAFSDRMLGGSFTSPYLLADPDDGGTYDADDYWRIDPYTGSYFAKPQRIPFFCIVPKATPENPPPYDVVMYMHGYGSTRLEGLLFAAVLNRFGLAVCSHDAPGHGPDVDQEVLDLATGLLDGVGLGSTLDQILDARHRDLDNDGWKDSGADQWTADPFHTRDMDRQSVLDTMQFFRSLRTCGTGTMGLSTYDATGTAHPTGQTRTACDWDDDGVPEIGGPDAHFYVLGGSLGGITGSIAGAVMRDVEAFVPVVPGGSLLDVGIRTEIGGAVEAFIGRFVAPFFLGYPQEDGSIRVTQMVNSLVDMRELPIGVIPSPPVGGRIRLHNLDKNDVREGVIRPDGTFRLAIGADAMDPGEKRVAANIPLTGPVEGTVYSVPDNDGLGDRMVIEVLDASGAVVQTIDTWAEDVYLEGVTMLAGSPLVAASWGNGKIRGSADARKLAFVSAMILEAGDPIAYAPHWFADPFPERGPVNVLEMPTIGDPWVPISAGIAVARAGHLYDRKAVDERYGTTIDRWLIDKQVVRGVEERGPYRDDLGNPVLFDPDDQDGGTDGTGAPSEAPLRASVMTPGTGGMSGLRIPYVDPRGKHGFNVPDPSLPFDVNSFTLYQVGAYLASGGTLIEDKPCFATGDCPEFTPWPADEGGAE